jgi:hypothetical protein
MAIGGFSGSDPAPTLAGFKKLVSEHKIHYFVSGGIGGGGEFGSGLRGGTSGELGRSDGGQAGPGGGGNASQITAWVEAHFTARTVGGMTVYDLTSPKASS